jgi:hypothetical protein
VLSEVRRPLWPPRRSAAARGFKFFLVGVFVLVPDRLLVAFLAIFDSCMVAFTRSTHSAHRRIRVN